MDSLVLISLGAGAEVVTLSSASAYAARGSCSAAASASAPFAPSPSISCASCACWRRKVARAGAPVPPADRLLSILPLSTPSTRTRASYSCGAPAPVLPAVSAHSSARGGGGTIRGAHEAAAIVAAQERRRRAAPQIPINHLPLGAGAGFSSPPSLSSSPSSAASSPSSAASAASAAATAGAAACCFRSFGSSLPSDLGRLSGYTWQAAEEAFTGIVGLSAPRGSRVGIDTWQASRASTVSNLVNNRRREIRGRSRRGETGRSMVMASVAASAEAETMPIPADKPVLFDIPVSNNGARVRLVLYIKEVEDEVIIKPPSAIGGLKSEAYLALNPLGKMPLLVFPDGTSIFESEVISEYFLDKYSDKGPSFVPHAIELRITSNLAKRILDMYISGNMASMYKAMDVELRAKGIAEINQYLDVLEDIITSTPYVAGPEISSGDTAMFPNFVFMNYMLPQFFGWDSIFNRRPKLQSWWETMSALPAGSRVREEMETALNGWKESGRWDKVGVNEHVKDTNHQWKF